ncbi:uncharacterized protein B0H64DRAFT_49216 [Chaetomium fimeti]|uniref:Uncharacterized protein n=1 Tax=Chaetomium fimeti TaxID=1854472 RepID=A0AAE0H6Q9_9PEZI|nr:hypothetical protein B0H64DRAFT_49216 [Chaetomium fimeti]
MGGSPGPVERASPGPCADGHWPPAESHLEAAECVPSTTNIILGRNKSCWAQLGPVQSRGATAPSPSRLGCKMSLALLISGLQINCLIACLVRASETGRRGVADGQNRPLTSLAHISYFSSRPTGTTRVPTIGVLFHAGLQTWCELDLQQTHPGRGQGGVPGGCHTTTARKFACRLSLGIHSGRSPDRGDLAATYAENLPGMPSEVSTHGVGAATRTHACHRPWDQIT